MAIKYYYCIMQDELYAIACDDEMLQSLTGFTLHEITDNRKYWHVLVDLMLDEPNVFKRYKIIRGEIYKLYE